MQASRSLTYTAPVAERVKPSEVCEALGLPSNARGDFELDSMSYSSDTAHLVYPVRKSQSSKAAAMSIAGVARPLHVFLTGTTVPALRGLCSYFLATTPSAGVPTIALSYEWIVLADKARNEMIENDSCLSLEEVLIMALFLLKKGIIPNLIVIDVMYCSETRSSSSLSS